MTGFERADEFACPGCDVPQSQLPADHGLILDDSGATICGNGIKPMEYHAEVLGAGGDATTIWAIGGLCATCGKPVPGGGHRDGCTGLIPGSEYEIGGERQ